MSPLVNSAKAIEDKELMKKGDSPLQTSLQTKPENGPKQADSMPPELWTIVDCWDDLPEHIKAAIMALVNSHISD